VEIGVTKANEWIDRGRRGEEGRGEERRGEEKRGEENEEDK